MSTRIGTCLRSLLPQPLLGAGTVTLALLVLAVAWIRAPGGLGGPETVPAMLLALFLIGAIVVTFRFPIHIGRYRFPILIVDRKAKIYMSSVPFYLLAVLVPPPLAATAAGVGALLGELSVRAQRGNSAGAIASEVGRRMLVVWLGALVAHLPGAGALHTVLLVGAAVALGAGDILSCPLVLAPMTGDPPLRIIGTVTRQAALMEGVQYLLGLLGVLAAAGQVWALALLALPTALVYLSFRAMAQAEDAQHAAEHRKQVAERQALHDALTGLPNRTLLFERAEQAVHVAQQGREPLALLLLDLDHFKDVNDTLGHFHGDLVLQEVAARLCHALRESDVVARLGGDEFAALLPGADQRGAVQAAQKIHSALDAPFELERQAFHVDTSIGIALYPEHGTDAQTLLREADVAMYQAKQARTNYAMSSGYSGGQGEHRHNRLALAGALFDAIASGRLVLHYQPQARLASGRVDGVEALVRWAHPQRGLIPPDEFIPLAERTGLIAPLTRWVLEAALRQRQIWEQAGYPLDVKVNLSMANLRDPELPGTVAGLLQAYKMPSGALHLELTESTVLSDPARSRDVLARLAALGLHIVVDDFGTGYSSLAYLKRLPMDAIKIDRSFVQHMSADKTDAAIVRAILRLGHELGLRVVAEGVEDRETWDRLVRLGCDAAQGSYLSRPLPAEELTRWLATRQNPWWSRPSRLSRRRSIAARAVRRLR